MKPKYYSCFFLSLFACDQGKIEVNNEKAQDVDPKGNLLNVDSSIIDVVNNLCEGVKDINDKNNSPAYVELTTKLVGEYANSFWSLGRCQGIVKQICEQVPSYPSQIVYDVLYALVKNKCLDAVGVQTIIQGIKEDNPKVFSLLNNYVCLNRSRVNETDDSARIIAESFGFILNKTIFIPGINTFTSTPIPPSENAITVNDLTDIWQCVNFIKNNEFDENSLKKLIELASSGDFNEAIKAIAGAGIFFKGKGDEMMNAFTGKYVNLNDEGLKALADCIQDNTTYDYRITNVDSLKHLFPSLQNCTDLKPIFNKYKNDVQVDEFTTLLNNINLNSVISLDPLVESLQGKKFNLECLRKLAEQYKDNSDEFNKVLDKINKDNFDQDNNGDDVIQAFYGKGIKLDDANLSKVLSMISAAKQISNCQKAIDFCCENIQTLNESNIEAVFNKVGKLFNLKDLKALYHKGQDKFDQILPCIPEGKFNRQNTGDNVINMIIANEIKLNTKTLPNVLSMIGQKISEKNNKGVFKYCCDNEFGEKDINKIILKCTDFKFDLNCLDTYDSKRSNQFNAVLAAIPNAKFVTNYNGNDVVNKIKDKAIGFTERNLSKVLLLCKNGEKKISDVAGLYFVFFRSYDDTDGVNTLINLVEDNSLNGKDFISTIDGAKPDIQKAFVEKFYSKIQDKSIPISTTLAKNFVLFTYMRYIQDPDLTNLKGKIDENKLTKGVLKIPLASKDTLQTIDGKITDKDFTAFKEKLNEVLTSK